MTYVKAALQLTVASQLHKHKLVDQEPDKVKGLRDARPLIAMVCHSVEYFGVFTNWRCLVFAATLNFDVR